MLADRYSESGGTGDTMSRAMRMLKRMHLDAKINNDCDAVFLGSLQGLQGATLGVKDEDEATCIAEEQLSIIEAAIADMPYEVARNGIMGYRVNFLRARALEVLGRKAALQATVATLQLLQVSDQTADGDCAVCLEKCQVAQQLSCGHEFCLPCLRHNFLSGGTGGNKCPLCRQPISSDLLCRTSAFGTGAGSFGRSNVEQAMTFLLERYDLPRMVRGAFGLLGSDQRTFLCRIRQQQQPSSVPVIHYCAWASRSGVACRVGGDGTC